MEESDSENEITRAMPQFRLGAAPLRDYGGNALTPLPKERDLQEGRC